MIRFCLVIQSDAFLSSAGMRIRYRRFIEATRGSDYVFRTANVAELSAQTRFDDDIYIFSKTFMPEALVLVAHLASIGKTVGHDIFDDYFSQIDDPRLARFQRWLADASPFADFAICTTEPMKAVLRRYFHDIPTTVVGDPYEPYDAAALGEAVTRKIADARASRHIRVCWFGIGDNPYFPVGIRDLAGQGSDLARLVRRGWSVDLHVLTNVRALSAEGFARLRDLPVPFQIEEWSEEREGTALDEAFLAFLPVNGQSFSRAKSLNRCLTALLKGCQVLSRGYPLYAALSDFTYRSADALASDLEEGTPRLSGHSLPALAETIDRLADPDAAAARFVGAAVEALTARRAEGPPAAARKPSLCVVHGLASNSALHKLANRLGGLSVCGPFQQHNVNYQVRFALGDGALRLLVRDDVLKLLRQEHRTAATLDRRFLDFDFHEIPFEVLGLTSGAPTSAIATGGQAGQLASYGETMDLVRAACRALFPSAAIVVSEHSELASATIVMDAADGAWAAAS